MGIRTVLRGTVLALAMGTSPVVADDLALIIGNEAYRNFNTVPNARSLISTRRAFSAAGYRIIQAQDASEAQIQSALDQFERLHGEADRIVIVLAGQFMTAGTATWFAPVDLASPSLAHVSFDGLQMSTLMAFLAEKAGGAALFLAHDSAGPAVDVPITKGVGRISVPQGVLLVQGSPNAVREALNDAFLQSGVSIAEAVAASDDLKVRGFVSDFVSLVDGDADKEEEEFVVDLGVTAAIAEEAFWQAAEAMANKAAYEAYLRRYPSGEFAETAEQRLRVIADATPKYTPEEQAELDMALTRNDRRRIQEQLSLLDINPRGIDGVFGPGSRAAIKRFQAQSGLDGDGYMNPKTLLRLRNQAEQRAAELAQEAEREKRQRDAADARLWSQTGARGTEADYLAYLSKYPNGLYSDAARGELRRIEQENRASAQAAERAAWDAAKEINTIAGYQQFLAQFPRGAFAQQAQGRLSELTASDEDKALREAAKREEEGLRMSPAMMLQIERKLKAIGLKPGKQDGNFTKNTRSAIRTYQNARGLPETGYITRGTVVRLMSE